MRNSFIIGLWWGILWCCGQSATAQSPSKLAFTFYGEQLQFPLHEQIVLPYAKGADKDAISEFFHAIASKDDGGLVKNLLEYKQQHQLDDWLFYQLIRRVAQQISPKEENYHRYTLYKWYLLSKSGYSTLLTRHEDKLLFYVRCAEAVYNIPLRLKNNQQFVCLNYHDYKDLIDFNKQKFEEIPLHFNEATGAFSYRVNHLPAWKGTQLPEKDISFQYDNNDFHFRIRFNPDAEQLFRNYPVLDYEYYFNRPMSKETYSSLIPVLKKQVKGMSTRNGVDFLMRFTRYAFLFEPDIQLYGTEKRMSPEETLIYSRSDCEDRAALFYFLVKEIYNLPMLVVTYPEHVTIAVGFDKPFGNTITHKGRKYTICEPTPQQTDLRMGELLPSLRHMQYMIAYAYNPLEP